MDDDSLPMRLYEKAKRLGTWDPCEIDFARDRADFADRLNGLQRESILRNASLFLAGEESVTADLLPLMLAIAREGRLEEELFLTTFLWEEGKHVQFFRHFLDEVAGAPTGLERFHTPSYKALFAQELPAAMNALLVDSSPSAQARAAVTYNMIVEGVLAETGYHAFFEALEAEALLPGLREGLRLVKRDESRHIAYGVFLLARLVQADPSLWEAIEARMSELLPLALGIVREGYSEYVEPPFGISEETLTTYATGQFAKRYARIERARTQTLAEVGADEEL